MSSRASRLGWQSQLGCGMVDAEASIDLCILRGRWRMGRGREEGKREKILISLCRDEDVMRLDMRTSCRTKIPFTLPLDDFRLAHNTIMDPQGKWREVTFEGLKGPIMWTFSFLSRLV